MYFWLKAIFLVVISLALFRQAARNDTVDESSLNRYDPIGRFVPLNDYEDFFKSKESSEVNFKGQDFTPFPLGTQFCCVYLDSDTEGFMDLCGPVVDIIEKQGPKMHEVCGLAEDRMDHHLGLMAKVLRKLLRFVSRHFYRETPESPERQTGLNTEEESPKYIGEKTISNEGNHYLEHIVEVMNNASVHITKIQSVVSDAIVLMKEKIIEWTSAAWDFFNQILTSMVRILCMEQHHATGCFQRIKNDTVREWSGTGKRITETTIQNLGKLHLGTYYFGIKTPKIIPDVLDSVMSQNNNIKGNQTGQHNSDATLHISTEFVLEDFSENSKNSVKRYLMRFKNTLAQLETSGIFNASVKTIFQWTRNKVLERKQPNGITGNIFELISNILVTMRNASRIFFTERQNNSTEKNTDLDADAILNITMNFNITDRDGKTSIRRRVLHLKNYLSQLQGHVNGKVTTSVTFDWHLKNKQTNTGATEGHQNILGKVSESFWKCVTDPITCMWMGVVDSSAENKTVTNETLTVNQDHAIDGETNATYNSENTNTTEQSLGVLLPLLSNIKKNSTHYPNMVPDNTQCTIKITQVTSKANLMVILKKLINVTDDLIKCEKKNFYLKLYTREMDDLLVYLMKFRGKVREVHKKMKNSTVNSSYKNRNNSNDINVDSGYEGKNSTVTKHFCDYLLKTLLNKYTEAFVLVVFSAVFLATMWKIECEERIGCKCECEIEHEETRRKHEIYASVMRMDAILSRPPPYMHNELFLPANDVFTDEHKT